MPVDLGFFWHQVRTKMKERRLNDSVHRDLAAAGWYGGRRDEGFMERIRQRLTHDGRFELFPVAEAALLEFGGLRVEQSGAGVDRARESFVLNPLRAVDAEPVFAQYSEVVGKKLFPLGEAGDQGFIAVADTGEVFLIFEGILLLGHSVHEALSNLIEGRAVPGATWLYT